MIVWRRKRVGILSINPKRNNRAGSLWGGCFFYPYPQQPSAQKESHFFEVSRDAAQVPRIPSGDGQL